MAPMRKSAIAMALLGLAGAAQANGHRLLWTPGEDLEALGAGQNALGQWQAGAGIVTGNPELFKLGVANQIGSGFTEGAGQYIHSVAEGRRSLQQQQQQQQQVSQQEYEDQIRQAGEDLKTVGKTASEKAKDFGEQLGDDFKQVGHTISNGFNNLKDTIENAFNGNNDNNDPTESYRDGGDNRRSLLWGEGLELLGDGQNALGQFQEGTGFWTGNPGLWKEGIDNQIGGAFTKGAGQFIHSVAGGRRSLQEDRNLLWTPGEGLEALAAGQNALGEFQEGAGFWTGNPGLWKEGVDNQIGAAFADGAGQWIHSVATGRRSLQEKSDASSYDDDEPVGVPLKRRSLLWGEGLEALGAGQNALGQFQEGTGFWTGNPGLWKAGVDNQIGAAFTEGAGQFIHAVAGGK